MTTTNVDLCSSVHIKWTKVWMKLSDISEQCVTNANMSYHEKNHIVRSRRSLWVCNSKLLIRNWPCRPLPSEIITLFSNDLPWNVVLHNIFIDVKVYITLIKNFRVSPLAATIMLFFLLFMTIAVFIFESTYSTAQSARGSSDGIRFQRVLALSNVKVPRFSFTRTSDYYFKIILHNVGENRLHTDVTNTF